MSQARSNTLPRRIARALDRIGYRVVRVPFAPRHWGKDATDSGLPKHFPVGPVRPWTLAPELIAPGTRWGAVLTRVYQDSTSWPSSLAPEAGLLLHALVRNEQPATVVETGTCLGVSTTWIAAALQSTGGMIFTFDDGSLPPDARLAASPLFHDRLEGVRTRLQEAGLGAHAQVIQGDSAPAIESRHAELRARGGVQLAFIDGDHSPAGATADFRAVEPVLCVGGLVILHDVFPEVCNHLGPRYLIDNLASIAAGKYEVCDLFTAQTNYGMTLLRRVG
jgi:predicted O-methyltransferase YrrM